MKRFFKWFGIFLIVVLIGLYIEFLFFLPKQIDLNSYKPLVKDTLKKYTDLDIDFLDAKLITTPALKVGIRLLDVDINLPDGDKLLDTPCIIAKLSIPRLFLLNVKLTDVMVYKPVLYFNVLNNGYKPVKVIEGKLYDIEKEKNLDSISKKEGFNFLSLIRYNAPNINIVDYRLISKDEKTNDYLLLRGDTLKAAYLNRKRAKLKTKSSLYLNDEKNIDFDIDINTFIPKKGELDSEDDPAVRAEVPFINPVLTYKNYDPKGVISAKLKLDEANNGIKGQGYFFVDGVSFNINGYKLPKSYLKTSFLGSKTYFGSDIAIKEDQRLKLNGWIKNKFRPDFDLKILSDGIYFNDIITLSKALLDSLGIENNLAYIKGKGFISADASIKTNCKSLKSKGFIKITDGAVINQKTNLGFNDIFASLIFDNNTLSINDTKLKINDGELNITGTIDKKANADITITSNKLPLPELYLAFAPEDIKDEIKLTKGKLSLNSHINGKLKNPVSILNATVEDLSLNDKLSTVVIQNKKLVIDIKDEKELLGKIANEGFKLSLPYSNSYIKDDNLLTEFDEKKLTLNPTQIKINNNTAITLNGEIDNYLKNPKYDFKLQGDLFAGEIKKLLGAVFEPFIDSKGIIPVKLTLNGNKRKQTLRAQIISDDNNYITPVHIKSLQNMQTIAQLFVDFKGNRLKIKDTGLYSKIVPTEFSDDFDLNLDESNKVVAVEGTVMGINSPMPVINMFKTEIIKPLEISFVGLKDSYLKLSGRISAFGNLNSPRLKGRFALDKLNIPDASLNMDKLVIGLNGKEGHISTKDLTISDSDIKFDSDIYTNNLPLIVLDNTKVISNNINADNLTGALNNFMSLIPSDPVQRPQGDIPLGIIKGNYDINTLKTGNIVAFNNKGDIKLKNNVLSVNNIDTDVFKGKVRGNADINLLNYFIDINVNGENIDSNEALIVLANIKDTLKGPLSFDADITLQGLAFEQQVKSLEGEFNFTVLNGQMGPFGKIENIFLSENIRESEFFKTAMGSVIHSAVSVDTSRFKTLDGTIKFKNGIAYIDPVNMQGNALCVKVDGNMDILKNTLDTKVRGRLGSMVSSVLGPLANVNPVNIVKATPGLNVVMAKTFSVFCEKITKEEMDSIPDFSKDRSDFNATKFQLVLKGDAAKPLSLLKSFKWLVTEEEYALAEQFVSSIPDNMPEGVTTLEELRIYQAEQAKIEAENKTLFGKVKNFFKKIFKKDKNDKL